MVEFKEILRQVLFDQYASPNPLREITETVADPIRMKYEIEPVRAHLGNPTGPLYEPAIDAMIKSLEARKHASLENGYTSGYDKHDGSLECRKRVAAAVSKIDLPNAPEGTLTEKNTFACNAGTGGLNAVFAVARPGSVIYAPKPTYPAWAKIAARYNLRIVQYDLTPENNFLPDAKQLKELMDQNPPVAPDPSKPSETGTNIVLFHYPHNPSGKTLSEAEAKKVGETLNEVVKHQPNSLLVQEDIYIATTHPDEDIVTPSKYFDEEALQHLVLIHSMSKAGHPQERTGVIAVPNEYIAKHISGALSFLTLGSSSTDFIGITETLEHIANGGLKKRSESADPNNYRYKVADYYQKRLETITKGLFKAQTALSEAGIDKASTILPLINPDLAVEPGQEFRKYTPRGGYYLFPDFSCLIGKEIPEALKAAPYFEERAYDLRGEEPFKINSSKDVAMILANAQYLGFRPVTVAPGSLFNGAGSANVRISATDPDIRGMKDIANTVTGILQDTLHVPLGARRFAQTQVLSAAQEAKPEMLEGFLAKLKEYTQTLLNPQSQAR